MKNNPEKNEERYFENGMQIGYVMTMWGCAVMLTAGVNIDILLHSPDASAIIGLVALDSSAALTLYYYFLPSLSKT